MTEKRYADVKLSDDPNLKLVAGKREDRLSGLTPLLETAAGCAVLDIACHNGTIAAAFAEAGSAHVDGVDFWRPGIEQARQALRNSATTSRFAACDLTGGMPALRDALMPLRASYDIVLYLGIHHHLSRQMPAESLAAFLEQLAALASRYVAIRTPDAYMASAKATVFAAGFEIWYGDVENATVGGLTVFRRAGGNVTHQA